jgi:hypothetical protein
MKLISNLHALADEQPGWARTCFFAACGLAGWQGPVVVEWLARLLR